MAYPPTPWQMPLLFAKEMADAVSNIAFMNNEANWHNRRSGVKARKARETRRIKKLRRKQGRI